MVNNTAVKLQSGDLHLTLSKVISADTESIDKCYFKEAAKGASFVSSNIISYQNIFSFLIEFILGRSI